MPIPFLSPVDLGRNELQNARVQNLAAAPVHGAGIVYFDTVSGLLGVSNGTTWTYLAVGSLDTEGVQDIVGAMGAGSTVVTATYNDPTGVIVYTIGALQVTNAMLAGSINADKVIDGTTNRAFLGTERTKLAGIATGATVNSPDATLLARANHTGTQVSSTISDFTAAVQALIATTVGAAPAALDTLVELAAALGNDANFATTITNSIGLKANTSSLAAVATAGTYASLTGKPTFNATVGDNVATTYVVTHSLGTRNVAATLYLSVAPFTTQLVEVRNTSTTTVTLIFGAVPTVGQYTLYLTAA